MDCQRLCSMDCLFGDDACDLLTDGKQRCAERRVWSRVRHVVARRHTLRPVWQPCLLLSLRM